MELKNRRTYFILFTAYLGVISIAGAANTSQNFWFNHRFDKNSLISDLDRNHFVSLLNKAPNVNSRIASDVILDVPTYNNTYKAFRYFETDVMPLALKLKYPNIKSYIGTGVENPSHRSSIVIFKNGLFGLVIDETGRSYIKVDKNDRGIIKNHDSQPSVENYQCEPNDNLSVSRDVNDDLFWDCVGSDQPCFPVGSVLTTYRFAGIMSERATNEVADGTIEGGLAWMTAMVNQINLLWIRELSFKLEMVAGSDLLIFTDDNPAPNIFQQDPSCHSSGDPKYCELEEVKPYLESVIGPGGDNTPQNERTWEYGAHFDTRYNGGVAYMPGSTSTNNPNYEVFNHEIGHNLGSPHNISIESGWRCSIGGTIMGSRVRTLEGFSGDQYSSHTIELAMNYRNDQMIYQDLGIWGGDYITGAYEEETGNLVPDLVVPESGFIIPKETPFILEGSSNPYNSDYTFSWEQNDASDESFSMDPLDNNLPFFLPDKGPLFASVDPTTSGHKRYFPSIETVLNNNYSTEINDYGTMLTVEKLPFSSRQMNMRLIVRTNDPFAGSLNHKNVQFFVAGTAGPFRLTSQMDSTVWEVGSEQEITWDVANTNNPDSVNCQTIDLFISLNGGQDFDFTLAENIPNNGSCTIIIPPTPPTVSGRLMIRANDNIFFDINNGNITIQNNNTPSLTLSQSLVEVQLSPNSSETFAENATNDGEEGSVLSFITYPGKDFIFQQNFSDGIIPEGWTTSTNADCDNPGWYVSEDASSSYFTIPAFDGYYIATNDDACGSSSDGSADTLYTNFITLPDGMIELSFERFFTAAFNQTFHVYISTDNWNTNQEILSLGYGNGNEEWMQERIPLHSYSGQTIQLGFHSNDNGNWATGVALDNIYLGVTPTWISSSSTGMINYQEVESFNFTIDTEGLSNGTYYGNIIVEDPYQNISETLQIILNVSDIVNIDKNIVPNAYFLGQNYPNPFNPSTQIQFSIPISENVRLIIYDILGNKVKEIINSDLTAGQYKYEWFGENNEGSKVGAGMYFYRLQAGSFLETKKMILLK